MNGAKQEMKYRATGKGELADLRRCTTDRLRSATSRTQRHEVYRFCANDQLFFRPLVAVQILERIATEITDIGLKFAMALTA